MHNVGVIKTYTFELFGYLFTFNPQTVIMTIIIMILMFSLFLLLTRKVQKVPGRGQMFAELIIGMFDDLTKSSMGHDHRKYFPIIMSIFLFVLFSNWIGVIPNILGVVSVKNNPIEFTLNDFKGNDPQVLLDAIKKDAYAVSFEERMSSVESLNAMLETPLLHEAWSRKHPDIAQDKKIQKMADLIQNYQTMKFDALSSFQKEHIKEINRLILEKTYPANCPQHSAGLKWLASVQEFEFSEPTKDLNTTMGLAFVVFLITHASGILYKGLFHYLKEFTQPIPALLPLNIIGELGKFVSLFFRLFGNIFGGGVIVLVGYTMLTKGLMSISLVFLGPVFIGYFGLFAGLIQAFVFTMLSMTFIAGAKN